MKTIWMKAVCMLLGLFLSISLYAQDKKSADNIIGEWAYEAQNVPEGYDKGLFKIISTNDELSAEVAINGDVMKVDKLKKTAEGKYTCTFYVDNYPVDVVLNKKAEGLEGYSLIEGQQNPITFKRVSKK